MWNVLDTIVGKIAVCPDFQMAPFGISMLPVCSMNPVTSDQKPASSQL